MATSGWSNISKENSNFALLCKLLIDGGSQVLRDTFDAVHPPHLLPNHLIDPTNYAILNNLRSRRTLRAEQWAKLYPSVGNVSSTNFDITLLCLLLRNICHLPTPAKGWNDEPLPTSINKEDDVVRIKLYRNHLYGHTSKPAFSDADFTKHWDDIETVLVRLGGARYKADIDRLRIQSLDPQVEKYYIQCLQEWAENEEQVLKALDGTEKRVIGKVDEQHQERKQDAEGIKGKLDEQHQERKQDTKRIEQKVDEKHQERKQDAEGIKRKLDEQHQERKQDTKRIEQKSDEQHQETHHKLDVLTMKATLSTSEHTRSCTLEEAEHYSQKLKTTTMQQTEMQPQGIGSSGLFQEVKTDQIFANLTIHDGPPKLKKSSEARADVRANTETRKQIQTSAEIFLSNQPSKENPKTILIDGKSGIGKTLFTQKLARDWAKHCIFNQDESSANPDFKFAFRIIFRKLNLLDQQEELTLMELLNLSSTLDGTSILTDEVFQYIIEHPDQLLVLFDGYDEFKHRDKITREFPLPNDPRQKMPVGAIITKLLRKEMLGNSVIVITSRTNEAIQMAQKIPFDSYLEIAGFSKPQLDNYVENHFESKPEEIKTKALNKVKSSPHYMSFGAVPLLSFLMCVVLEYEVKNNLTSDNSVSQTLTEFYNHVLYIIERFHNRCIRSLDSEAAKSAVSKILDNFARLSARLMQQNRFYFTKKDLKELKIPEQEIAHLTSSSLLSCIPLLTNSPVPEITSQEYSFHHYTFQEFLAARHFVSIKQIPKCQMTEMFYQFFSGLLDPQKGKKLMVKLLKRVRKQLKGYTRDRLVSLQCLYEYKNKNKEFVTRVLMENHHQTYWHSSSDGWIELSNITDMDCRCVVMLVDTLTAVRLTSPPDSLYIVYSSLTSYGVEVLMSSLTNNNCTITKLLLWGCKLDDECVEMVGRSLHHSNITDLTLYDNNITDNGVTSLIDNCSKLITLNLSRNPLISDECRHSTRQLCGDKYPDLGLDIHR